MRSLHCSVFLLVLTAACGDDPAPEEMGEPLADAAVYEGCPATTPAFELGMLAQGQSGHVVGKLLTASPNPPLRFINDWTVGFQNTAGETLTDVEITDARPFMPVHGHDGNVKPVLTRNTDGSYHVANLNLVMRGPWEIQLHVNSASLGADYTVFHVCVVE